METPLILPKKRYQREHKFQSWVDRLIDRIVLPPMFVTGIDHAGQTSDNARARMAARGIKFGLCDMFVAQHQPNQVFPNSRSAWLELKRDAPLSPAQIAVHKQMRAAGQFVAVCRTMQQVVAALQDAGINLTSPTVCTHLAAEYEARSKAAENAPRKPAKPSSKPRGVKVSPSKIARVQRVRSRYLP
jgi:hypothetical protein